MDVTALASSGAGEGSLLSVANLRDPLDTNFTVVLNTGQMVRCSLPPLQRHPSGLCGYSQSTMKGVGGAGWGSWGCREGGAGGCRGGGCRGLGGLGGGSVKLMDRLMEIPV